LRRFSTLALVAAGLLVGCRVTETPEALIDYQDTPQAERQASADELRDRLLATGQALRRGNRADVLVALAPVSNVYAIGPDEGQAATTPSTLAEMLEQVAGRGEVTLDDLAVSISANNNVAWFRTELRVSRPQQEPATVRFSGVFVREEGDWRLSQAHLSRPVSLDPETPAEEESPATGAG
jgi:hypothetical protein